MAHLRSRYRRWVLALLAGLCPASACNTSSPTSAGPESLWRVVRLLPSSPNQPIGESEANAFWGSSDAEPLSEAVANQLQLSSNQTRLEPRRATGRTFVIEGAPTSLYARSWSVSDIASVSLVNYSVVRGKERIDWSELFVQPEADRAEIDALGSTIPNGLYGYLVPDPPTGAIDALTPEQFARQWLEGAKSDLAPQPMSTCDASVEACSFMLGLQAELVEKEACLGVGVAAGITAGATCTFSVVGALLTPACVAVATSSAYLACDFVTHVVTDTVANGVCQAIVNCFPGHSSACECPFDDVCSGVETLASGACQAISSYAICGILGTVTPRAVSSLAQRVAPKFAPTLLSSLCDSAVGSAFQTECEAKVELSCEADATGAGGANGVGGASQGAAGSTTSGGSAGEGGASNSGAGGEGGTGGAVSNSGVGRRVMSSYGANTCAVLQDGSVTCWSNGGTPAPVRALAGVTMTAAGFFGTCFVLSDGTVQCSKQFPPAAASTVQGLSNVVDLAVGSAHACAVREDKSVACWGANSSRQLGVESVTPAGSVVTVPGISDATRVSAGREHTCALLADGSIECWGSNSWGQLGVPLTQTARTSVPVLVALPSAAADVSAGDLTTCSTLLDGTVQCWGHGLWIPGGNTAAPPTAIEGLASATLVDAGGIYRACALLRDGAARCWGDGPLGDGTSDDSLTPVAVVGPSNSTALTLGSGHTCARLADATVTCWGCNPDYSGCYSLVPKSVPEVSGVR